MANQKGDTVSKGHYFNVCTDETNKTFETRYFHTDGEDVEFNDGDDAETKVGAIKGITSDLNTTTEGYAADMTTVAKINSSLGGLSFAQNADGKWGYKVGADAVIPFSDGGIKDTTYIGGFINADSNVKYTFDKAFTGYLVFSFGSHYPAIPNIVFDNVGALCEIISYGGKGNVADGWGGAWRAGYIIYKIDIPVNTTMTCSVKVTNDAIFFTIKC